jgi:hypothetical protein
MRKSIRNLIISTLGSLVALPAMAGAPWEEPKPEAMTERHEDLAQGVLSYLQNTNPIDFGEDPLSINWDYPSRKGEPISNMSKPQLDQLLRGKYYITQSAYDQETWSLIYYGEDNKTHFCMRWPNGAWQQYALDRHIRKTWAGPAGLIHWDPEKEGSVAPSKHDLGWPVIYNPGTGELTQYSYFKDLGWVPETGWLQAEFPDAAREACFDMPRSATVNENQSGDKLMEMIKGAKPVKGRRVAFENDNSSPLTSDMFYWYFNPKNWKDGI